MKKPDKRFWLAHLMILLTIGVFAAAVVAIARSA